MPQDPVVTRYLLPLALLILLALFAAVGQVTGTSPLASGEAKGEVGMPGKRPPAVWVSIPPRPSATPSRASRSEERAQLLEVTGYCETGNRTASGLWPRVGMAAGNRWKFGTQLRVPGYGIVTIQDRIGSGSDLDLFMASCGEARQWGRRHLRVQVVR